MLTTTLLPGTTWALQRAVLEHLVEQARLDTAGLEAAVAALSRSRPVGRSRQQVAVLPIVGLLFPRGTSLLAQILGATSLEETGRELRTLAADESVGAIVLDMDTPGGMVEGTTEFAAEVRRAREQKPVVAVANFVAASAGYWIAASATEVVAAPSAKVGSIGVFALHDDRSKALEAEGVTRTVISAGKHKVEGNELGPLSDEARATAQALVDEAYGQFVADVATGRGVSVSAVRDGGFGEGRALSARKALEAGMVDRIETLDQTIARVVGQPPARRLSPGSSRRARQVAAMAAMATPQPTQMTTGHSAAQRRRATQRALLGCG